MRHWDARDLELLAALRARFIQRTAGQSDYWTSDAELRLYDQTFAERIGWKIDAAIRALTGVGWRPRSRKILDWGCGTGIATRRILAAWPEFDSVSFVDRSERAVRFARDRLRQGYPHMVEGVAVADSETLLVVSHVLNELPAEALEALLEEVRRAGEVLWVEAGTHADSRALIAARERILSEPDPPRIIAPCPHQRRCGLLAPENSQHWCHFFAKPPVEVFQDARWAEWSRAMGIDIRALPYSYLVLSRNVPAAPEDCSRVLGGLRENKGYCRALTCTAAGVHDYMLQKRDAPEIFRTLTKTVEWPLFKLAIANGKIVSGDSAEQ